MHEQIKTSIPVRRYWEVDFARGIAVILMLVYHFFFDAQYFNKIYLAGDFWDFFWFYFPRLIGGMFIFISGFSVSISIKKYNEFSKFAKKKSRRAVELALIAGLITTSTYLFVREEFVVFGIIHFFALATFLSIPFSRRPILSLVTGVLLFSAGLYLQQIRVKTDTLLWLGLMPENFRTLDYYPLLPWFGVFLLGISAGHFHREFKSISLPLRDPVIKLGRNSLKIYLIQHPVILLLLQLWYGDIFQTLLQGLLKG